MLASPLAGASRFAGAALGSAYGAMVAAIGAAVVVAIPNLADDVDTREDLDRVHTRLGPHTLAALQGLRLAS